MVSPVTSPGGYQAYAYQQAVTPVQEQRGGENRIEQRDAPAADSQRSDQRNFASRDTQEGQSGSEKPANQDRGKQLDITA